MASPMFELPEHLDIPVNVEGHGPAPEYEAVWWVCWCGDDACEVFPARPCL